MIDQPTPEQLAASMGVEPGDVVRSVLNRLRTEQEGTQIWTSFVNDPTNPEGDLLVFETRWPQ